MIGETSQPNATTGDAGEAATEVGPPPTSPTPPREIGGREGPEPTRYGDWEKNGRCIDF